MLNCGLIGLSGGGKTTLFELLTKARAAGYGTGRGVAAVPDERVDFLSRLYHPRKTTYAQIEFLDLPGLPPGGGDRTAANRLLAEARKSDALLHVLRGFPREGLPDPDPVRDLEELETELVVADLEVVERRLERVRADRKADKAELPALERCREALEGGRAVFAAGLSEEDAAHLRGYELLTGKPALVVANLDEAAFRQGEFPGRAALEKACREKGYPLLTVAARIELEIDQLEGEDRQAFMEDLGLSEPGIQRLCRAVYRRLGLISFLTAGEDEVRAWTVAEDTPARQAAGKIHSDIERGFIRAEVASFTDLEREGSLAVLRDKGLLRLEGRDYPVKDGDIINFRFNVTKGS